MRPARWIRPFSPTDSPSKTLPTNAIVVAEDGTGDVVVSGPTRLLGLNRTGDLAPTFQEPTLSRLPASNANGWVLDHGTDP